MRVGPVVRAVDEDRRLFLQRIGLTACIVGLDSMAPDVAFAAGDASSGVSSASVRAFLDAVAKSPHELHSFSIARHGQVAAQAWFRPYRADAPQLLYSLSKSFTSTAVGFAVTEGKLKLSDRVVDFFPDKTPQPISENLAALRIEHLLTMSVGHAVDSTPAVTHEHDWVKTFLAIPIVEKPGSVFVYDSAATYMLSAILQKVTGQRVVDYLRPRFFDPLHMPPMNWAMCPLGINTGGWGLSATTETLNRFGQFYLQKGRWNGKQLLPAAWIEEATRFHIQQPAGPQQDLAQLKITSDWHQGYGYQFWRCRHDAYRGDGAFGQYMIVLPDLDAVIAITSCTLDMQGFIDLVWQHLLPGFQNGADDARSDPTLKSDLAALSLKLPEGASTSPRATSATYTIASNALGIDRVALHFSDRKCQVKFGVAEKDHAIDCGIGAWLDGETELPGTPPEFTELVGPFVNPKRPAKLAAAGAWKDADTFHMQWRYYETPHSDSVTLKFSDAGIEIHFLNSLTQLAAAVHPETRPVLSGSRNA